MQKYRTVLHPCVVARLQSLIFGVLDTGTGPGFLRCLMLSHLFRRCAAGAPSKVLPWRELEILEGTERTHVEEMIGIER